MASTRDRDSTAVDPRSESSDSEQSRTARRILRGRDSWRGSTRVAVFDLRGQANLVTARDFVVQSQPTPLASKRLAVEEVKWRVP